MDDILQQLRMPGATLATRLKVYDTTAPDGKIGGTPHVHFLCTEMYFVTEGSGWVEIIDMAGLDRVELHKNSALIFSPGTIHRLINPNGNLELFIVMQNSGLPERGDNVVSFAEAWMSTDAHYKEAMHVATPEDARLRRDRGVEGFNHIQAAFDSSPAEGQATLKRFYQLASERTASLRSEWEKIVREGALAEATQTLERLDAFNNGSFDHLGDARHFAIQPQDYAALGFCGTLNRYFDPATLTPEGVVKRNGNR